MKLLGAGALISPNSMLFSEWRKPFNVSIGLHIVVVGLAMLAPILFERQPRLPEIYTVNLFTATEVAETLPSPKKTEAAKPVEKTAVRQIEPETQKPARNCEP